MNKSNRKKIQYLQSELDKFGADRSRWPSDAQELWDFVQDNPHARKLYHEGRALDLLLDQARLPEPEISSDLQQSVLADFSALHATTSEVVVPIKRVKKGGTLRGRVPNNWMNAAAMAACFAFGIYLGGVGIGDWSLDLTTDLASLTSQNDQFSEIADAVMSGSYEEELL